MATYTASWENKHTVVILHGGQSLGKIEFEKSEGLLLGDALLQVSGHTVQAKGDGKNIVINGDGVEIFTAIFRPLWGNFELQLAGEDTGYDVRGKWFKPGTRLTDDDDHDLVVVTSDALTGKQMKIVAVEDASALMVAATIYLHIRASAAKTMATMIGIVS